MKSIIVLIFLFLVQLTFAQSSYLDKNKNEQLWGRISVADLQEEPFKKWYDKSQTEFKSSLGNETKEHFQDVNVKIFLGTWCGDTKFLLPRFMKTWKEMGLEENAIELIAVHNSQEHYKQGPEGETKSYNIHKVPTLIFEKQGKELGRIVERSVFSLEEDMLQIVTGNKYEERYQGVRLLEKYLSEVSMDSLANANTITKARKLIRRELSSVFDLYAYGYVLLAQEEMEKADFVFSLNKELFPYNPYAHEAYAEFLKLRGDLKGALESYYEVLRIKKEDSYIIKQLAELQLLIESTTLKS